MEKYQQLESEIEQLKKDNKAHLDALRYQGSHRARELKKIEQLKKDNELMKKCVEFYAEGKIGNDLEIRPDKKDLWSIPDKWSQRSMSDHYAGKLARQTLKALSEAAYGEVPTTRKSVGDAQES